MTKRFGFTLAEVLITLGIIGVVAAMTMPTLMNSTQGAQYKAAYKKALSALSQAITLNVALDEVDFGDVSNNTQLETILKSRMNVVRTTGGTSGETLATTEYSIANNGNTIADGVAQPAGTNTTLFMNDGIMFSYNATNAVGCTKDTTLASNAAGWTADKQKNCSGFVDVNGTRGPNKVVVCDGTNSGIAAANADCKVTNPTDIYPVMFYDSTVLPSTDAARAVLYGK